MSINFATPLAHPTEHFDQLHTGAHGTVILWEKGGKRWHKLDPTDPCIPSVLSAQVGQPDRYLTVNEFHGWRLVRLLKSLRANFVDLDGMTDIPTALDTLRDAQMPPPSAVVKSGRGLHLYWLLQPLPAKALPVWQRVQDALVAACLPIGGDPAAKDCARVLRLVGSVNSKNGEVVRGLVFDPTPWTFHHLADEVLGYRPEKRKGDIITDFAAAKGRRGQRLHTGSVYDRWHLVYQDLLKIAEYYGMSGVPTGHRNTWLYLSAVALSWFANPQSLSDELEQTAKKWTPGLNAGEIRSALKQTLERAAEAAAGNKRIWQNREVDPRYHFKRETLWQLMRQIIPADLAPQLRAIVSADTKAVHEVEREAKRDRVAEGRHKRRNIESIERAKPLLAAESQRA